MLCWLDCWNLFQCFFFWLFLVRISCYCLGCGLIAGAAWLPARFAVSFVQACRFSADCLCCWPSWGWSWLLLYEAWYTAICSFVCCASWSRLELWFARVGLSSLACNFWLTAISPSWSPLWCCCCFMQDVLLLVSAAVVPSAGLEGVLLLVFGSPSRCFHCMLVYFALWLWCLFKGSCSLWFCWSRESVPLVFLFSKLVLLMVCTRESVPFAFCLASLSCFWFGQGTLFPFPCIAGLQRLFDL